MREYSSETSPMTKFLHVHIKCCFYIRVSGAGGMERKNLPSTPSISQFCIRGNLFSCRTCKFIEKNTYNSCVLNECHAQEIEQVVDYQDTDSMFYQTFNYRFETLPDISTNTVKAYICVYMHKRLLLVFLFFVMSIYMMKSEMTFY